MPSSNLAIAAITAGGQSRRFGSDKALALWQGKPLLEHVAASFPPAQHHLLIAPVGKYALANWVTVPDLRPGFGPLAGLETALSAGLAAVPTGAWVAFAGVDNPKLAPAYWHTLLAARTATALSVQALHPQRGPQPLGALYHTNLLPHVSGLLDAGERRLKRATAQQQVVWVEELSAQSAQWFCNLNEPEALAEL